jgi:hypothetical protein
MADYYTLETVKDQLLQNMGTIDPDNVPRNFPPDWQYCPCKVLQNCIRYNKVICNPPIYVGIYIQPPRRGIPIIIEIVYERATQRGFIRANNMKIKDLINNGKINPGALTRVTLPF